MFTRWIAVLVLALAVLTTTTKGGRFSFLKRLVPPFFKRGGAKRHNATVETNKQPVGLRNLANTCYMNSVLQSVFYARDYRDRVLGMAFLQNSVGHHVASLFQHMSNGAGDGAGNPVHLARALGLNVATQEDAQEFMLRLLHEIDDSLLPAAAGEVGKDATQPPSHVFQGRTEHVIRCTHVDFTKTRTQRFLDLTVDMVGFDRLEDALADMFTRPDMLTGENRYRAAEPHGLQDAEKRVYLTALPQVLCVTLKRFSYDVGTNALKKVSDRLEFPLLLDMGRVCSSAGAGAAAGAGSVPSGTYDLSSVVIHEGTASFGHYTCCARPDPRNKPDHWLLLNDHLVSEVPHDAVCRAAYGSERGHSGSSAYILFYTKR